MLSSLKKLRFSSSNQIQYVLEDMGPCPTSFKFKDLNIIQSSQKKTKPELTPKIKFGENSTDHMLTIRHDAKLGWQAPQIQPIAPLSMSPFNSALHYGLQCFEGMKAFHSEPNPLLFRPLLNMNRLRHSTSRLAMPDFCPQQLLACISALISLERSWVPQKDNYSLYIRPNHIAFNHNLGIHQVQDTLLYVVLSPVGPYYPTGFKPVSLLCQEEITRAAPGSPGNFKLGSNYGGTILPGVEAEQKGFNQVLWLCGEWIGEVGTSNIFFLWINEQGQEEIITPPANEIVLHGVTRHSVIEIIKEHHNIPIVQRMININEITKAIKQKRVKEIFTSGTAVTIGSVKSFFYSGQEYSIPVDETLGSGPVTHQIYKRLTDIQYGRINHEWSYPVL